MAARNQQVRLACGAVLLSLSGAIGEPAVQAYTYQGLLAPKVEPNPLAHQLEQKLRALREQIRERSIETTLEAAVDQSLLHNPELALAFSQIQEREWSLIAVRREWYPKLKASSGGPFGSLWGYQGTNTNQTNSAAGSQGRLTTIDRQRELAASLDLNWTFFDPSRGPNINAAGENLRSQELLFNIAARNLVLQTQLSYFELQEQLQLINSYERILAATTEQVSQVEALFNIGGASIADVEQIRTQQYSTISQLIGVYRSVITTAAALAAAMALPQGQLALPAVSFEYYGRWELSLDASIQQAQSLREEIQSSLALASSSRWRASALFNSYWPRLHLAVGGFYRDTNRNLAQSGSSTNELTNAINGAVGVGFIWSIFDGGIAAAQAEANQAIARQRTDQAAQQSLQITREVEQSYGNYEVSSLALLSTKQQAESAEQAAIAVRERFNVGYDTITTVVQSLNQAIQAAIAFSSSQREYNSAVAQLYRATAQWPGNALSARDASLNRLASE